MKSKERLTPNKSKARGIPDKTPTRTLLPNFWKLGNIQIPVNPLARSMLDRENLVIAIA